jgi:hypothetical protein
MKLIEHQDEFKTGTRVLMLKGRNKDGVLRQNQRTISLISHSESEFDKHLNTLLNLQCFGERIYASAGERSVAKASRIFRERQLASEYDDFPAEFYRKLHDRWVSCLMSPQSQDKKVWLFDWDQDSKRPYSDLYAMVNALSKIIHTYETKNGRHILTHPFDKSTLSSIDRMHLHENALMLWGY